MLSPNYKAVAIDHEMDAETVYVRLLMRLSHLAAISVGELMGQGRFEQIAGTDRWSKTVIKAFLLWAEGDDFQAFLRSRAEANEPWEVTK